MVVPENKSGYTKVVEKLSEIWKYLTMDLEI